jgi:hypothetical protein
LFFVPLCTPCALQVHAGLHAEALALCVGAMGGPDSLGARRICSELTSFWVQINSEAKFNRCGVGLR